MSHPLAKQVSSLRPDLLTWPSFDISGRTRSRLATISPLPLGERGRG
jgi:hypothetical protein